MEVAAGVETGPAFKAGGRKEGGGRAPGTRPGVATALGVWGKWQKILPTYRAPTVYWRLSRRAWISPSQQPCEAESIDPILGGGNRGLERGQDLLKVAWGAGQVVRCSDLRRCEPGLAGEGQNE